MTEQCKDCKYYQKDPGEIGECHRFPPTVVEGSTGEADNISSNTYHIFPIVSSENWCGEFKEAVTNLKVFDPDNQSAQFPPGKTFGSQPK